MRTGTAVGLLLGGVLAAAVTGLYLRSRLPPLPTVILLAVSGVAIGAGALGAQEGASPAEWVLTLTALAAMAPLQVRLVLGRFGRADAPLSGTVGRDRKR